ncbi:GNAT family N-acetyltransferase [Sphingomonas sp. URHD0057]|uniref:GNAT family N-acetyltransferase n=1 Tax=Sphingomonas sp. URHD0057 TaxID=1380389 RepID=UPI00068692BE|nr:GNAT family N-acetyltransferase [Sphingomonas sp. URHD0057]
MIRPARDSDRDAIAAIHTASWQDTYRDVLPDDLLDGTLSSIMADRWQTQEIGDRDVVLVAQADDGEILGFAATWVEEQGGGYIDNLHVQFSAQSQGLGRAMLRETAAQLLRNGVPTGYLHVVASNQRARSLYMRLGGEPGPIEDKNLYGTIVPNQRIDWSDLSILAG